MRSRRLLAVFLAAGTLSVHAAQDQTAPVPATFEVASVRPNRSGEPGSSIRRRPGGNFSATNVPVQSLLVPAFGVQRTQLVDAPRWVATERFDIIARMEREPPVLPPGSPDDPMTLAVRALLEERFRLVTHRETREMDVYALVMARPDGTPGPALRPTQQDCVRLMEGIARGAAPPPPAPGGPEVLCGVRQGPGRIVFGGSPLAQFANSLSRTLERVVVDRTGLTGGWDFELTFAPDPTLLGPLPPGVAPPAADPDAPSLFTALREQLGLKLESARGPVEVVVIDRIERPAPE